MTKELSDVEVGLVLWNKMGDHPLVTAEHNSEFPYEELAAEGCGFIDRYQIVRPGNFILEMNGHVVAVLSKAKVSEIFNVEL